MCRVGVWDASRLLCWFEAEPKVAWQAASGAVRAHAFADGWAGPAEWYRTANRIGYQCGQFRALPFKAVTRA